MFVRKKRIEQFFGPFGAAPVAGVLNFLRRQMCLPNDSFETVLHICRVKVTVLSISVGGDSKNLCQTIQNDHGIDGRAM